MIPIIFLLVLTACGANIKQNNVVVVKGDVVTLEWDGIPEPDWADCKIYGGESSGNYGWNVNVGKVTKFSLANLRKGVVHYLVVTARDSAGNESGFSNEVAAMLEPDSINCDVNRDGVCNITDWIYMKNRNGYTKGHALYDVNCDFNADDRVDGTDQARFSKDCESCMKKP